MKYFTKDLWSMMQIEEMQDVVEKQWDENIVEYEKHFELIKDRFSKKTLNIIKKDSLHDAHLHSIEIIDRNTVSTVNDNMYRPKRCYKNPINIKICVFTNGYLYTLKYSKVCDIKTLFSADGDLFLSFFGDFGDWGYSEFSAIDKSLLCHDILFSSGAEIRIVFKALNMDKKKIVE